jgi:hypothetical protein
MRGGHTFNASVFDCMADMGEFPKKMTFRELASGADLVGAA